MLKRSSIDKWTALFALKATGLEQDWDVELANENRIGEFFMTYERLSLSPDDRFALMALILASVDRYIEARSKLPDEWKRISDTLLRERYLHKKSISYWRCDDDDDSDAWFHLTPHIRALDKHTIED